MGRRDGGDDGESTALRYRVTHLGSDREDTRSNLTISQSWFKRLGGRVTSYSLWGKESNVRGEFRVKYGGLGLSNDSQARLKA